MNQIPRAEYKSASSRRRTSLKRVHLREEKRWI